MVILTHIFSHVRTVLFSFPLKPTCVTWCTTVATTTASAFIMQGTHASSAAAAAAAAASTGAPLATTTTPTTVDQRFIGGNKHDAKYDRQLRLWGKEGQQALAEAHVVAIGVSASVVEALKSIVLTGVHAFTIVDDALVTDEDIATNFFVLTSDKGKSLAEATARQLSELNSDCVALAVHASPADWAAQFTTATEGQTASAVRQQLRALVDTAVVVANRPTSAGHTTATATITATEAGVGRPSLLLVSQRYANHSEDSPLVASAKRAPGSPPVLCVQTRGLMGFYQAFAHHDMVITMPHPTPNELVRDLRIFNPFPALRDWFVAHDPSDPTQLVDDIVTHSHIPYPAILYHAYTHWCAAKHAANEAVPPLPLKGAHYAQLKPFVWRMARRKEPPQEAFVEAVEKCTTALNRPYQHYPSRSLVLLWVQKAAFAPDAPPLPCHDRERTMAEERAEVERVLAWYVTRAIREFAVAHSPEDKSYCVLPQCGHLPDFTATTEFFQELRAIYQAKHAEDAGDIAQRAWAALNETDVNRCALASYPDKGGEVRALLDSESKTMVQNVWQLALAPFASCGEYRDGCGELSKSPAERLGRRMAAHWREETHEGTVLAVLAAVALDSEPGAAPPTPPRKDVSEAEMAATASRLSACTTALLAAAHPSRPDAKVAAFCTPEDRAGIALACEEMARVGAVQVPSVAATMGALASQEAIKLIQHRRVPAHDPIVYSGYSNTMYTLPPF